MIEKQPEKGKVLGVHFGLKMANSRAVVIELRDAGRWRMVFSE